MIYKLMEGFQGHHKKMREIFMKDKSSKKATNTNENAGIVEDYFNAVFYNHADMEVVKKFRQHEIKQKWERLQQHWR